MNNRLSAIKRLITSPRARFEFLDRRGFFNNASDEWYIKRKYKHIMGKKLNLKNPQTFNEKLQWLKLYDHNPFYTTLVDKYAVKEYVAGKIGEEYIIRTLGVWDRFEDIDFDQLPDQFVLKCTHDSGGLVICRDKSKLDKEKARAKIVQALHQNFYLLGREWPYKNVKPRIIAEEYMEDSRTAELRDYKFFVCSGKVKALFIATDRQKEGEDVKFDFFDADFHHLPFKQGHENAKIKPEKPVCFEKMKELAETLASNLCEVRIDFYEVDGKIYFGEITFFHHGGWTAFDPKEWDYTFGSWIKLPEKTTEI